MEGDTHLRSPGPTALAFLWILAVHNVDGVVQ
jgi:hypothetical protein